MHHDSILTSPFTIRSLTLPNRMVLAPMLQYAASDGLATDWHLVHLGKFALGGMGLVLSEAVAVEERGRISHGDLGIWDDRHIPGLKRITDFIRSQGVCSGIQLAHAGRKGGWRRPWHGNTPLDGSAADRGEAPWQLVGPMAEPVDAGFTAPHQLSIAEIGDIAQSFGAAAARADAAGFDVLEIHGAHGYLIASFLTPAINRRSDQYGGSLDNRMRFALDVVTQIRLHWPAHKPLFFRMSAVDGSEDGWGIDDSVALAVELIRAGVDVIDCSSGGVRGFTTIENQLRGPGYQVPYSEQIRGRAGVATMAVGLILDAAQAETVLRTGQADLIAIGRQAMYDPYWAHHARQHLGADPHFDGWNQPAGWWLARRAGSLAELGYLPNGAAAM